MDQILVDKIDRTRPDPGPKKWKKMELKNGKMLYPWLINRTNLFDQKNQGPELNSTTKWIKAGPTKAPKNETKMEIKNGKMLYPWLINRTNLFDQKNQDFSSHKAPIQSPIRLCKQGLGDRDVSSV